MINAGMTPGPGTEVALRVYNWAAVASENARAARRSSTNAMASHGGYGVGADTDEHDAMMRRFSGGASSIQMPVKNVYANAKLQEVILPFLPAPLYVIRWRLAKNISDADFDYIAPRSAHVASPHIGLADGTADATTRFSPHTRHATATSPALEHGGSRRGFGDATGDEGASYPLPSALRTKSSSSGATPKVAQIQSPHSAPIVAELAAVPAPPVAAPASKTEATTASVAASEPAPPSTSSEAAALHGAEHVDASPASAPTSAPAPDGKATASAPPAGSNAAATSRRSSLTGNGKPGASAPSAGRPSSTLAGKRGASAAKAGAAKAGTTAGAAATKGGAAAKPGSKATAKVAPEPAAEAGHADAAMHEESAHSEPAAPHEDAEHHAEAAADVHPPAPEAVPVPEPAPEHHQADASLGSQSGGATPDETPDAAVPAEVPDAEPSSRPTVSTTMTGKKKKAGVKLSWGDDGPGSPAVDAIPDLAHFADGGSHRKLPKDAPLSPSRVDSTHPHGGTPHNHNQHAAAHDAHHPQPHDGHDAARASQSPTRSREKERAVQQRAELEAREREHEIAKRIAHLAAISAQGPSSRSLDIIEDVSDGEGDGKKKRKVNAGNSVSSGSSAGSSTAEALRKGIDVQSKGMEVSLVNLRRSLVIIFLVVAAMNIASVILSEILVARLRLNLETVALNGDRLIALQSTFMLVQNLNILADGSVMMGDNGTETRAALEPVLNELAYLHQELYSRVDESDAAERYLYTANGITVHDFVHGSYVSRSNFSFTNRSVNLGNGALELVAKARTIAKRENVSENLFDEPSGTVFWVLENGPKSIHGALDSAMRIAQQKTAGQGDTIVLASDVVLGIALGLLFLNTVAIMIPAIRGVMHDKAEIFQVILKTPLAVLRSIRGDVDAKVTAISRAMEEAEAGMDVGGAGDAAGYMMSQGGRGPGDGFDNDDASGVQGSYASGSQGSAAHIASSLAAQQKQQGEDGGEDGKAGGKKKKKKQRARRFRRGAHVGFRVIAAFAWPILLLCAYYLGTWAWKRDLAATSEYSKSELFYAHQMQFLVGQSNFHVRNIIVSCDPAFVAAEADLFHSIADEMEHVQDSLLYGNEDEHIRPLLKISPAHFTLMMENGCVPGSPLYDYATCRGEGPNPFFDGLVGKGLQGAYKQYLQLTRKVVQDRFDLSRPASSVACTPGNFVSGSGFLIDQLANHYLAAGFGRSADNTREDADALLDRFRAADIIITCASIIALFFFYYFVYSPHIVGMDREIKKVRHLLLLFPDDVARQVPAIVEVSRKLLTHAL
jgi:hypothetical protein